MRDGGPEPIICPCCFVKRAEAKGVHAPSWRLTIPAPSAGELETPRTDVEEFRLNDRSKARVDVVDSDFARDLERENQRLAGEVTGLKMEIDELVKCLDDVNKMDDERNVALTADLAQAKAQLAQVTADADIEARRWQDAIRDKIISITGIEAGGIDGAGCDSGDPLDVTIAEVCQGLRFVMDARDDAEERLRDSSKQKDAAIKSCVEITVSSEEAMRSLRSQVEALRKYSGGLEMAFETYGEMKDKSEADLARLTTALAAAEKDYERLDWLESHEGRIRPPITWVSILTNQPVDKSLSARQRIDAARAQQPKGADERQR